MTSITRGRASLRSVRQVQPFQAIGDRLRAYRLASGLTADALADQLGVSRTTLYRLEGGDMAKIGVLERISALLDTPVPVLMGGSAEYVASIVDYVERLSRIERGAEQMMLVGPLPWLLMSDDADELIEEILSDLALARPDDVATLIAILRERKAHARRKQPEIVSVIAVPEIQGLIDWALGDPRSPASARLSGRLAKRRSWVTRELLALASLMERRSSGLQVCVTSDLPAHLGYHLVRRGADQVLAISPFRIGARPVLTGVAMLVSAPDGLAAHAPTLDDVHRRALKGAVAADCVRQAIPDAWMIGARMMKAAVA